jgi:NADH:ubiquinone oxidoreductase subunit 5 (subunit L)/multisubunit Na+/H+ antiporter MnhA subunit
MLENPLLRSGYNFLWNRLYVNPAYYLGFVNGALGLSGSLAKWVEVGFFDRISGAVSQLSVGLSKGGDKFDLGVVDGAVNGVATTGKRFSSAVARLQTGVAQQYLLVFAFGVFLVVLAMVFLGK